MRTLAFLAAFAAVASGKDTPRYGHHPHFNDGGTLRWHTDFASAAAAAKKEGKLVFIEYGREA